jgi:hypothetical protein
LDFLKRDNYKLFHENKSLKTEKSFLIEQIKFMQSLIKSNTLVKSHVSDDIEKNTSENSSPIYMNGAKQRRPFGKLFSVFVICVLSLAYVSFDGSNMSDGKIEFNSGSMALNDVSQGSVYSFYYLWLILKIVSVVSLLVIVMVIYNWICDYFEKKGSRKNDKFL